MGSSTNIGFVYGSDSRSFAEVELSNMIHYLLSKNGKVLSQKYSKDLDGDGWVESNEVVYLLQKDTLSQLVNNYYGQIKIACDLLGKKGLVLDVLFKKLNQTCFGILLDISDEQILDSTHHDSLDRITDKIVELMECIYSISHFDYAFCDNEAQIEYSLSDFVSLGKPVYSVIVLPNEISRSKLQITKSNWHIDGLTPRKN